MPPEPGSPEDWMRFAYSDLSLAQGPAGPRVIREALCFHAEPAVEKSFKAILLAQGIRFPPTHNLKVLFDLLPRHLNPPPEMEQAVALTDYAVSSRYPGQYEPISEEEYQEAVRLAEAVVLWADTLISKA